MVQGSIDIAVAGGVDDPENPIGTDPIKVYEAITSVYSRDGVLVLMDLGSALLSAEMAVEFLSSEQRENVWLCDAPLIEGVVAAAVQASVGSDIHQVLAEARGALSAKTEQLRPDEHIEGLTELAADLPTGSRHELQLIVSNRLGLHARPAARFVSLANQYQAKIFVSKADHEVNGKSINQVATLGVRQGDEIKIAAVGPDAQEALEAIYSLAAENFGDPDDEEVSLDSPRPVVEPRSSTDRLTGIPASPGIAIGPVVHYRWQLPAITTTSINDPGAEWNKLQDAIVQARDEIQDLYRLAVAQVGNDEAAIFNAHLLFLQDPALIDEARDRIFAERINAEAAWQTVTNEIADRYLALPDTYMQARAADVHDVGYRVLEKMMVVERPTLRFAEPSILLARELLPSDTAVLDPHDVLAICTELGGATSHSAILARTLGIPAVVGLVAGLDSLAEGQTVIVDGSHGQLIHQPTPKEVDEYLAKRDLWLLERERAKVAGQQVAITRDNHRIEVAANIGGPKDVPLALSYGAEGVGLFRTEFLFLDRERPPSEEEQYLAYRQVAESFGQQPVVIRTLDVGGDKPLPYLDLGQEENPFLGWRGIRFCLDHPEIFKPQLKAILRASNGHNIKLMFPMISSLDELIRAKAVLTEASEELRAAGHNLEQHLEVGVMIEVPAAVMVADELAAEVDFFSIGTNDLTQYIMAADRGNPQIAGLVSALQPAVLRMIKQTVQAGHRAGIWVGLCGELAGNTLAVPLLIGLGLDEISMNAPSIPTVKEAIRGLTLTKSREIADEALALGSLSAVSEFLTSL
jgi:phosphocarrier protein FPr